jgi:hypothetical protein
MGFSFKLLDGWDSDFQLFTVLFICISSVIVIPLILFLGLLIGIPTPHFLPLELLVLDILTAVLIFAILAPLCGVKIKRITQLVKYAAVTFVLALIPLLLIFFLLIYPIIFPAIILHGPSCAFHDEKYDICVQAYHGRCTYPSDNRTFSSFDPFSEYGSGNVTMLHQYEKSVINSCAFSLRYFLYFGPHNPITLFIGSFIAWRFLKK